jgi:uncharacterized protein (DUF924 family)
MSLVAKSDSIREFWFGSDPDDAATAQQRSKLWWSKNQENDEKIRKHFADDVEAAAANMFDAWTVSASGMLSLILLTDQFPRNIYRGMAKAFAFDRLAQNWCLAGLDQGMDRKLRPIERVFFYLPLEHSESSEHQALSVQLFTRLYQEVPHGHMDTFRGFLIFALRHRRVIERFGRFPHRNKVLGRTSTPEEVLFLQEPGSSF